MESSINKKDSYGKCLINKKFTNMKTWCHEKNVQNAGGRGGGAGRHEKKNKLYRYNVHNLSPNINKNGGRKNSKNVLHIISKFS
jgi:hypothetical protein